MEIFFKNICITGAGNGIGRAIAIAMSKEGYNVVCADIDLIQANETLEIILDNNGSGISIEMDVTKSSDIKKMIKDTVVKYGSLDILVNNAGVTRTSKIMDLTEDDWDWIHNVNAKGTFFCLQAAAKQMIKQNNGGRIINMASVGGKGFVDVSNAIYAASKGAVISLTKTAAQELAKHEITVNSICPGITYTNILSDIVKKRSLEQNKSEEDIMKHYVRDIPYKGQIIQKILLLWLFFCHRLEQEILQANLIT